MRLKDVVVKRSAGRIVLQHLRSPYSVDVNEATLAALAGALSGADASGPGAALVDRLARRGLVDAGPWAGFSERAGTPLVSLELEPVSRCNLDCAHCFVAFSGAAMTDAVFSAALAGARSLGAVEVTLNGGEPLLHPRALDWLDAIAGAGLRPLLFTNGTLVTARVAERLARAGVARVTVSLDGFAAANDTLRGPRAFARATAGLRHLVRVGVQVAVTTLVHPGNEAEVERLHRFCREDLGVHVVRVSTIAELGRARGRAALQLGDDAFRAVHAAARPRAQLEPRPHLPCQAGVDKLFVSAAGAVHACHLFDGAAPPLGRLPDEPLDSVYARAAASAEGALFWRFDVQRLALCRACAAFAQCHGGCRARAQQMTGDPFGVDPVSCRKFGVEPRRVAADA